MRNARKLTQGLFLLAFLFLLIQTESKGNDELGYPVRLFLDFDPLIFVTTLLSAHAAAKAFLLSIITIILTIAVRQGLLRMGLSSRHAEQPGRFPEKTGRVFTRAGTGTASSIIF